MSTSQIPTTAARTIEDLRTRLKGRVIEPADGDYDALRVIALGGTDPRPALIIRPLDDQDVAEALTFAQASGLALAVRSGGHSGAAHGTVDGGVVLDVRDLKAIDVDPVARTAWVEAGATAGEVAAATAEHGLAIGFGDTGTVGVSGITLGGGVGFLARKLGLTIDNLLAADVVTADGQVLRADETSHPDLFWALRGGGGNFGVVTRFQFRLAELPGVVGGMLILPASAETLAGFLAAAEAAPEELSAIVNVMPCPPMPFVPAEHHGSLILMGLICFAGGPDDGAAALAPFRSLAEPLADMVAPIPYPAMFPPADPDYHPTAVSKTLFLDSVDLGVATTIMERIEASDATMRVAQLRVLGGAVARVPAEATAYAHRSSRVMANVAAFFDGPEDRGRRLAWIDETVAAIDQGAAGAYVNFIGDEGTDRVRAAYPGATWDRLVAVKSTYDPTNLFRRNHNIPPAPAA